MRTYYKEVDLDGVEHPEAFENTNDKTNKFISLVKQVNNDEIDLDEDDYVVDKDDVIV